MRNGYNQLFAANLGGNIYGIQHFHHFLRSNGSIQYGVYVLPVHVYHALIGIHGAYVYALAYNLACAQLIHELYGPVYGIHGIDRLYPLYEACGGVGNMMQLTGSVANIAALEYRRLKEHSLSILCYFGVLAAHYACYAHALYRIGYEQHIGRNLPFLAVKGNYLLPFLAPAHYDMAVGYAGEIERVHRMAVLHHYVICNIHYIVYGTKANAAQALLQPRR